ncbi:MAG TPA: transposase [Actinomycetota bacterium]|jgi:transposase|nr:transposase [Actinomycetota bacterium]
MSDAEWAVCEPLLPYPAWLAGKGGRPSAYCMRDIVDGIRYLTHNGPVWRALPADFPPAWTIYYWTGKWQADRSVETMHDQLRERVRLLDGGYARKLVTWSRTALKLTLEIVKRPDDLHAFKVLPRRWVVERTLAWITRHRRTVRDHERTPSHHETYGSCGWIASEG